MAYEDLNLALRILGFTTVNETPVDTNALAQSGAGNGLLIGEAAVNNTQKRFWLGMGKYQTPIEISNVIILKQHGETPSNSVNYNAGTLIINTVDNLAWVGTGNQTTDGSFISINGGGITDLDGGTF